MDSGKRRVDSESESKRLKEGDDRKIGKVSEFSCGLIDRVRTMEDEYVKAEEKCRRLEAEKRNLEMDMELVVRSSDDALEKLQAAESEIEALKNLLECKDGKITQLDREKMKILEELQYWVLQMEEAVNEFTRAKGNGDLQISDQKKRLEKNEQMKVQVSLPRDLQVSEKEEGETEAEDCRLERDKAMEDKEKKIMELLQRIEVLEKENRVVTEAKHASREKSEFERNLKEEQEKENLELVHRIGILEKEKQDLEDEIKQKDEVIQVLVQENDCLEDKIKKLNMGINKRAVKMHLTNDVASVGTLTQNQGQRSGCFLHSDEQSRILSYENTNHVEVKIESENEAGNACKRPLVGSLSEGKSYEETEGNSSIVMQKRKRANP